MPRHPGGGNGGGHGGGDGPDGPDGPSRRDGSGSTPGHPATVPEGQRIAQSEADRGRAGRSSGGGGTDRPRAGSTDPDDPLFAAANPNVDLSRITPPGHVWRTDNYPLIRVDTRNPDVIFEQGFHPKDPNADTGNYDLDRHVYAAPDGPFVSTSYAHQVGAEAPAHFEYEIIAPGGIDMARSPGVRENPGESEVAFPGGVDRRFIRSAQEYDPFTNEPVGPRRMNPYYEEWRTPDEPPR